MPSRKPLKGGAPRLYGNHSGTEGRAYRVAYDTLAAEFALTTPLLRFEAGRVAALMVQLTLTTRALVAAQRHRRAGRGRRPNVQQIERLARRQGLSDASYSQAVDKLRDLAAAQRNGHGASIDELLRRVGAAAHEEASSGD